MCVEIKLGSQREKPLQSKRKKRKQEDLITNNSIELQPDKDGKFVCLCVVETKLKQIFHCQNFFQNLFLFFENSIKRIGYGSR